MFALPTLTSADLTELERLRCLRLFWRDNPRAGEGLALIYWRALQHFKVEDWAA